MSDPSTTVYDSTISINSSSDDVEITVPPSQEEEIIPKIYIVIKNLTANKSYTVNIYDVRRVGPILEVIPGAVSSTVTGVAFGPKTPQNVRAYGINGGIYMTWGDPSGNGVEPTSFKVYRVNGSYIPQLIATILASERSFLMPGLENGTPYDVAIFSDAGNPGGTYPDPAALITNITPQVVPAAPVLQGTTDNNGQITLSWDNVTVPSGLTLSGYVLYFRSNGQDVSGNMGLITTTTFNGIGFPLFAFGVAHPFRISALATNGAESLLSNLVTVTPDVTDLAQFLTNGQSIETYIETTVAPVTDIAVMALRAAKQKTYATPEEKKASVTSVFNALKAKAKEANSTAVALSIFSSANSGFENLLTDTQASLPDKPVKIIVEPEVSVSDLGSGLGSSYVYFNLPQKITLGTRWIQFAADYTYTTSESSTPSVFDKNTRVAAGGLIVNFFGIGSGFGNINFAFTATLASKTDTSITFTLAGVDTAPAPASVSVLSDGSAATSSLSGTTLTISDLTPNTPYVFTIQTDGYTVITDSVTTTADAFGGGGDDPICFLAAAPVLTPGGYRPIASLCVGDAVMTADGRPVAIRAVKVMTCTAGPASNPFIIPRGAFGAVEELMISPRHRVAVGGGRMIEARDIGLEQAKMKGIITYYNLELPNWGRDNLVVAGVEVESLAPVRRRAVSMAVFKRMIQRTYGGNVTPAVMARVVRVCRFLPNGDVEIPVMKRSSN